MDRLKELERQKNIATELYSIYANIKYMQNGVDGYMISAPIKNNVIFTESYSQRFYNPISKELEHLKAIA